MSAKFYDDLGPMQKLKNREVVANFAKRTVWKTF